MSNEELREMISKLTPENREKFWNYYFELLKEEQESKK